jgi:prevent-host-death family protein
MSVKISLQELHDQLSDLLDDAVQTGEEYVVQRNGKDYAVIVSVQEWRRRTVNKRLDALGPANRLSRDKQTRMEALLAANRNGSLTPIERRELKTLLRECDAVLTRRSEALDTLQ